MRLVGFGIAVLVVAVVVSAVVVLTSGGGEQEPAEPVAVVEAEVAGAEKTPQSADSPVATPSHTLAVTASAGGTVTPGGTTTHDRGLPGDAERRVGTTPPTPSPAGATIATALRRRAC